MTEQFGDLKELLLTLVEDRLGKQGYNAMRVDEIAHAAGISTKTIYTLFKGKEDMASQVFERLFLRIDHELARLAEVSDPLERFRQSEAVIAEIMSPIGRLEYTFKPIMVQSLEKLAKKLFNYRTELLKEAQEKGLVRAGIRPELVTLTYVASIRALIDPSNRMEYGYAFKPTLTEFIEYFLAGLKPVSKGG
jgi:AcrR family transcriptional regulator